MLKEAKKTKFYRKLTELNQNFDSLIFNEGQSEHFETESQNSLQEENIEIVLEENVMESDKKNESETSEIEFDNEIDMNERLSMQLRTINTLKIQGWIDIDTVPIVLEGQTELVPTSAAIINTFRGTENEAEKMLKEYLRRAKERSEAKKRGE
ncbi:hypothetical protein NQ314_000952 [Rhamnusium bicolor]|uniref:Uncharacterized protein n=1 Tax=Rhamnusium bicolor TaxID=1586634 RepID=A0AAV8ZUH7_9CUCU|nr:hypothetical protein NQ314_000952 [Rhamnusium bicolor]